MKVGDVVIPNRNSGREEVFRSGSSYYTHAIVASLEPFALVSEHGDMLWSCTWEPHEVTPLCQASAQIRRTVRKRWKREPSDK